MRDCHICAFVRNMDAGDYKDKVIEQLKPGAISADKLTRQLAQEGLKTNATSIRLHRSEQHKWDELPPAKPAAPPAGWEPFAEHTESIGSAIVRLPTPKATAKDLLVSAGFDPAEWQIAGPINTRRWMRYDQEWLYYYKFDVIAGESPEVIEEHIEDLVHSIRSSRKPSKRKPDPTSSDAFVFAASDWQIGKAEGADGTPQTIERVLDSITQAGERIQMLRRAGRMMPELLFAGLGDLGEGTCGFYPGQQFLIDRTRRQQGVINRELITTALDHLGPMFDTTRVAAVGGNHGENRDPRGNRITSDGDNDDCAYFDAVREAFDRAGNHNITWDIMEDELSMRVLAGGVPVGLTHGHLFQRGKGGTPQAKAHDWWKGQDFGMHAVRGTQVLLSAHFHHFSAITYGWRSHMQTPAMDPGSKWYRESRGEDSPPGTLTFRLDAKLPLGWGDLEILQP